MKQKGAMGYSDSYFNRAIHGLLNKVWYLILFMILITGLTMPLPVFSAENQNKEIKETPIINGTWGEITKIKSDTKTKEEVLTLKQGYLNIYRSYPNTLKKITDEIDKFVNDTEEANEYLDPYIIETQSWESGAIENPNSTLQITPDWCDTEGDRVIVKAVAGLTGIDPRCAATSQRTCILQYDNPSITTERVIVPSNETITNGICADCIYIINPPGAKVNWDENKTQCETCKAADWDEAQTNPTWGYFQGGGACCGDDNGENLLTGIENEVEIPENQYLFPLNEPMSRGPYFLNMSAIITGQITAGIICYDDGTTAIELPTNTIRPIDTENHYYTTFFDKFPAVHYNCYLKISPKTQIQLQGQPYLGRSDEGWLTNEKMLCSQDQAGWKWLSATTVVGQTIPISFGGYDMVSDGTDWYVCYALENGANNFMISNGKQDTMKKEGEIIIPTRGATTSQSPHAFICNKETKFTYDSATNPRYTLVEGQSEIFTECTDTYEDTDSNKRTFAYGQHVFANTNGAPTLYFCAKQPSLNLIRGTPTAWVTDLDQNEAACKNAVGPGENYLDLGLTFGWTGSKCCGDDSINITGTELTEYYIDTLPPLGYTPAGCWANRRVINNSAIGDDETGDQNLLPNPSFEEAKTDNIIQPAGWIVITETIERFLGTYQPPEGAISLHMNGNAVLKTKDYVGLSGKYKFSFYIQAGANENPEQQLSVTFIKRDSDGDSGRYVYNADNYTLVNTVTLLGQQWKKYEFEAQVDTNEYQIILTVAGDVYIDSVSLLPKNSLLFYAPNSDDKTQWKFYSCADSSISQNDTSNPIGGEIINNSQGICSVIGTNYCGPDKEWHHDSAGTGVNPEIRTNYKTAPKDCNEGSCWNETTLECTQLAQGGTCADQYKLTESTESCCPKDHCWTGEICVNASVFEGNSAQGPFCHIGQNCDTITEGYRCVTNSTGYADWQWSTKKKDWYENSTGWCKKEQCFVSTTGPRDTTNITKLSVYAYVLDRNEPIGAQCLNSDQWIGDHLCEEVNGTGYWTSRTKYLAVQLIKLAQEDYTLYCDTYTKALNYYNYSAGFLPSNIIYGYYGDCYDVEDENCGRCSSQHNLPCMNNFCILTTQGKTYFGVSTNYPINEVIPNSQNNKIVDLVGGACSGIESFTNDGKFRQCTANSWYNSKYQLLIYNRTTTFSQPNNNYYEFYNNVEHLAIYNTPLSQAISQLFTRIQPTATYPSPQTTWDFRTNLTNHQFKADHLYIHKEGSNGILAFREKTRVNGTEREYYLVEYKGMNFDVCKAITAYDNAPRGNNVIYMESDFLCKVENGIYIVYAQPKIGTTYYPKSDLTDPTSGKQLDVWQYLTSRLRPDNQNN